MKKSKSKASFIDPMLCLSAASLPENDDWEYELKLDGYRAEAIKTYGMIKLRSRNDKDFTGRYPSIAKSLNNLPDETVIDGEIVAFDETGRPSFNTLQNYGSWQVPIFFYVFDLLLLSGRDIRSEPLETRRELLRTKVLSDLDEPIRYSPTLDSNLGDLIESVRQQKFEGLIAKRRDSRYESGQRTGAWLKMRVNQGQEFVIGGYTSSPKNFDALIWGLTKTETHLCRTHTQWFYTINPGKAVSNLQGSSDGKMSICKPSRSEKWAMGSGSDGGEDEGMPLAKATAGRAV